MSYTTNAIGPERGPIRHPYPFAIGVFDATFPGRLAVGIAHPEGADEKGRQLWRLEVLGEELPGRWLVIDRRFVEAEG